MVVGAHFGNEPRCSTQRTEPLPAKVKYVDYANWQQIWSRSPPAQQLQHWRKTLTGAQTVLHLRTDRPKSRYRSLAGDRVPVLLPQVFASAPSRSVAVCVTLPRPTFRKRLHRCCQKIARTAM